MADVKISELPPVMTVQATDLTVVSEPAGLVYTSKSMNLAQLKSFISQLTTKGDLLTYSTQNVRLPVGANSTLLRANSATATGLEWGPTLTKLGTGFSLADGTAVRTLTVTANSTIDQNLETTADVLFNSVSAVKDWDGSGLTAPFYSKGLSNSNKQLYFGFETTNDVGVIQATELTVGEKELKLNPEGGQVSVGYPLIEAGITKFSVMGDISAVMDNPQIAVSDVAGFAAGRFGIIFYEDTDQAFIMQGYDSVNALPLKSYINAFGGNVGVGTTFGAPTADFPLHVHGLACIGTFDETWPQLILKDENDADATLQLGYSTDLGLSVIQSESAVGVPSTLYLQAEDGSVAIGTDGGTPITPAAQLHSMNSTVVGLANTAVADGDLYNSNLNFWLDEATPDLNLKTKDSTGTVRTFTIPSAGNNLWEATTTYLKPLAGNGYIGIKLFNAAETENITISYEVDAIHYNSTDSAALHIFDQTIQPDTNIRFNNSGALTQSKGLNLTTADDDWIIGYDNFDTDKYSMRFAIAGADSDNTFDWTAGAFLDRTVVMSLTGEGDLVAALSVAAPYVFASGLSGATANSRYVGATASGAPVSGSFVIGDYVIARNGAMWICTVAGSPGTWVNVGTSSDLWQVVDTTYLRPQVGSGYIGVKLFNAGQTQSVRLSYESNGVYYDSTDAAVTHRFWQTISAETTILLNQTGPLTTAKGIQLAPSIPNVRFGYDDGSIRTNLADNTKSHIWSSGTIGSAVDNATLSGLGRLRVNNVFGVGLSEWAAGVFGTTTGEDAVALGWFDEVATIGALSNALDAWRDLQIVGIGKNLTLVFDQIFSPSIDVVGTLYVTGAGTFDSTLSAGSTVTGIGDTAAFLAKGASNNNRQLSIGFHASLDICQITATKVGTGIMGLELYGNHCYLQATSGSHLEVASSVIDIVSTTTTITGSAEGVKATSTGVWRAGVFTGNGGTNNVCLGNLSGVACIGGNNSTFSAWAPLYIFPNSAANLGIGLDFGGGQTANAQLHSATSTIVGVLTHVADANIYPSQVNIWLDEGSNLLNFTVKYSGGTVKNGSVALV